MSSKKVKFDDDSGKKAYPSKYRNSEDSLTYSSDSEELDASIPEITEDTTSFERFAQSSNRQTPPTNGELSQNLRVPVEGYSWDFGGLLWSITDNAKDIITKTKDLVVEKYDQNVPDAVKEQLKAGSIAVASVVGNAVATTANEAMVAIQKTSHIIDSSVKPTVYDSTLGYFYSAELIKFLILDTPEGSTILDVGIGTAYSYCKNVDLLREKRIRVVGVDSDASYIRKAKHNLIDYSAEDVIEIVDVDNIYETDLGGSTFDFVVFSDSYPVIPNVNNMLIYCERFLKPEGYMVVVSALFDEYAYSIDLIKQNLKYISSIEYGQMMLKSDLEDYVIKERRYSDVEFKLIKTTAVGPIVFKSYLVKWKP